VVYSSLWETIAEQQSVTCHMGSCSINGQPTQVNALYLNPARQTNTRFTYPWGMESWVDYIPRLFICPYKC